MFKRLPLFISISLCIIFTFATWKSYLYFFDTSKPEITVIGLEENGYYKDTLSCIIEGSDNYKIHSMKIIVDDKPLLSGYHKINKKRFQHTIALSPLTEGEHTLFIELQDASYNQNKSSLKIHFTIDSKPLQSDFTKHEYKIFQGRTLRLQFHVNKPIKTATAWALSHNHVCVQESEGSPIYECFIPIAWDTQPNEYPFNITLKDFVGNELRLEGKFQVIAFPFVKQTINVDPKKIAAEAEIGKSHQELEKTLATLTKQSPNKKLWHGLFYVPLDMKKITTEYGTIRITQDRGIRAHTALDLVSRPKGVIWASQDGIVVLKERYALSGNTVVIDHGCGILSLYYHLDSFADTIEVGNPIKRGSPLGTEGMTGYANGYHLHWEIRVNNTPVEPMEWTKNSF